MNKFRVSDIEIELYDDFSGIKISLYDSNNNLSDYDVLSNGEFFQLIDKLSILKQIEELQKQLRKLDDV